MTKVLFLFFMILTFAGSAQVWVSSEAPDPANKLPHPSAAMHVYSANSNTGVLLPSFINTQLDSIAVPANGMILFNAEKKCFMVYNSGAWNEIGKLEAEASPSGVGVEGEVRYSTSENTIWWFNGTEWKEFDTNP